MSSINNTLTKPDDDCLSANNLNRSAADLALPTKIIVFDYSEDVNAVTLCMQAIFANTDLTNLDICLYTKKSHSDLAQVNWNLFTQQKINIYYNEYRSQGQITADLQESLISYSGVILLDVRAIVASGWLATIKQIATREDIAVVVSREIRHRNDRLAWDLVPYAMNANDIDIAISVEANSVLNPGFDESNFLVSLSRISLFCTYFKRDLFVKLDWQKLATEDLSVWLTNISDAVIHDHKMHLVYSPNVKVYHASIFN